MTQQTKDTPEISLFAVGYGLGVTVERKAGYFAHDLRKLCERYGVVICTHPLSEHRGELPDLYIVARGTGFADGHRAVAAKGKIIVCGEAERDIADAHK